MSSLSYFDSGVESDLKLSISGIDWVATTVPTTGRPSVASMSIQGGAFDPVDDAVTNVLHSFSPQKPPANVWNSWLVPVSPLLSQVISYSKKPMH